MTIATTNFDYGALDKDAKGKLIWFASQIQKEGAKHVSSGLEIGRMLSEARDLIGAGKTFELWAERECGCSRRSLYNYMAAFEHFGASANFALIELSAMYELASNNPPECEAKNKALKLAAKGVKVTHAMARQLVSEAAPKEVKRPASPPPDEPKESEAQERDDRQTDPPFDVEPEEQEKDVAEAPTVDFGKCPNCASTKWTEDDSGVACAKCHHPYGEATGGADDDRIGIQRSKTVKTVEALMRAFDDLHMLLPNPGHGEAIRSCKALLQTARAWK